VQLGYTSDIVPTFKGHRFFSLKLPFLLLKPSANKKGKANTGECLNFNKFIYTNFKATSKAISKKAGTG